MAGESNKVGEAYVEIGASLKKLRQDLKQVPKEIKGATNPAVAAVKVAAKVIAVPIKTAIKGIRFAVQSITAVVKKVVGTVISLVKKATVAAVALGAAIAYSVKQAADAAESRSRFGQIFGGDTDRQLKFGQELADAVGRSRTEVMDAQSSFAAFASGMGFAGDQAAAFSQRLTALAIDFGSFNNQSTEESIRRFISAMAGSSEVVAEYGINLKEAALRQKLLEMGVTGVATEAQKAFARLAIIEETMGKQGAIGDAIRTAGEFTNTLRRLQAEAKNVVEALGGIFLGDGAGLADIVDPLIEKMRKFAQFLRDNAEQIRQLIATVVEWIFTQVRAFGGVLRQLFGRIGEWLARLTEWGSLEGGFFGKIKAAAKITAANLRFAFVEALGKVVQFMDEKLFQPISQLGARLSVVPGMRAVGMGLTAYGSIGATSSHRAGKAVEAARADRTLAIMRAKEEARNASPGKIESIFADLLRKFKETEVKPPEMPKLADLGPMPVEAVKAVAAEAVKAVVVGIGTAAGTFNVATGRKGSPEERSAKSLEMILRQLSRLKVAPIFE